MLLRTKQYLPKLIRFGLVGVTGAIINIAVYWVAISFTTLGINMSAILAFGVAVTNNYVLNHSWTFAAENGNRPVNRSQFVYYVLGNILGLGVNLFVLNVIVSLSGIEFNVAGQLLGMACGMISNFVFAKIVVFPSAGGQDCKAR